MNFSFYFELSFKVLSNLMPKSAIAVLHSFFGTRLVLDPFLLLAIIVFEDVEKSASGGASNLHSKPFGRALGGILTQLHIFFSSTLKIRFRLAHIHYKPSSK